MPPETDKLAALALIPALGGESAGYVRGEGRNREQVAFELAVIDFFVAAADLLGVPKSVAILYGAVFASVEPVGFSDLERRLQLSRGSISQGIRVLREVGAIKPVGGNGDRIERFLPDMELRKIVDRWLVERLQRQVGTGRERLRSLARGIPGGRSASGRELRARVRQLQNWHDKAAAALPVVRGLLKIG
ncbi:MAG: hypothetical protein HZA93_20490 [Verrucomicrobia bacterium]|nr:hypothetical protein [Verrucomicrobiota bacterium]